MPCAASPARYPRPRYSPALGGRVTWMALLDQSAVVVRRRRPLRLFHVRAPMSARRGPPPGCSTSFDSLRSPIPSADAAVKVVRARRAIPRTPGRPPCSSSSLRLRPAVFPTPVRQRGYIARGACWRRPCASHVAERGGVLLSSSPRGGTPWRRAGGLGSPSTALEDRERSSNAFSRCLRGTLGPTPTASSPADQRVTVTRPSSRWWTPNAAFSNPCGARPA